MSYYDFPHTRNYDTDLGYLIQHINDWDDELAKKADLTYVNEQLELKVNVSDYNKEIQSLHNEVDAKVDKDKYAIDIQQLEDEIGSKQDLLESGINIKTINNQDITGPGNIDISGGGGSVDIIDNLESTRTDAALSANQGRVLDVNKQDTLKSGENIKTINGQSVLGEGNIEVAASIDIIDDLTSTRTDAALSANQGKVLNEKFGDYATTEYVDGLITTALNASY